MRRPIKAHLVNRSNRPVNRSKPVTHAILNLNLNSNRLNRPVNRSNRPVYRYEPIELSFLNLNLNSTGNDRFLTKPDQFGGNQSKSVEFKFEFKTRSANGSYRYTGRLDRFTGRFGRYTASLMIFSDG